MTNYYRFNRSGTVYYSDRPLDPECFTPVVVIDPEDREEVERLARELMETTDRLQAALREFAKPTPPKPEEPTGLYARVRDSYGDVWFRSASGAWRMEQAPSRFADGGWCAVEAVEVLSEGVES